MTVLFINGTPAIHYFMDFSKNPDIEWRSWWEPEVHVVKPRVSHNIYADVVTDFEFGFGETVTLRLEHNGMVNLEDYFVIIGTASFVDSTIFTYNLACVNNIP
jgi:hypothetical protein